MLVQLVYRRNWNVEYSASFTMNFSKMKTDCVGSCNENSSVLQSADCLAVFAY